ncbi:cardiolipin synthase [Variovorax sp. GrIS 2.14]|jgi:cardiolipin synthase|uniref:cardiolipin synthase ClsB n=1 Tax=unclassified Variovorax TaxID=663243 RepID=UPI002B23A5B4|nr:cardiolipin synthase ClsB [Variovorax sp. RTB1]MEB0109748.1 cardiolipin synthase ClsB [Variovorax sp. RTB1]
MSAHWIAGNTIALLENGEEFFPRVFGLIAKAEREVIIETFILFEDEVGLGLRDALVSAASRGVKVDLMIDGFGSPDLSPEYMASLTSVGVRVRVFDPGKRYFGQRLNIFRRMHRKLVVIDGARAFVGGINYAADHLIAHGPKSKQDYVVELTGPIVVEIHRFVLHAIAVGGKGAGWFRRRLRAAKEHVDVAIAQPSGTADVLFVSRDNRRHTNDIERHYRAAIRAARQRVVIANAYFFPGYLLIQEMRRAARRGVDVKLILQGEPDMPIVKTAASMLYHHLLNAGVRVYEYCERPLHGKVAVMDDRWSTVGSSNLDPLSLSLNLEANVIVRDREFNGVLADRLDTLIALSCKQIKTSDLTEWSGWRLVRSFFIFHLLRWYPAWIRWLPRHAPRLQRVESGEQGSGSATAGATQTDTAA